ncbi:MAG: hypothetical protein K2H85_03435, partial [Allobaculum sp.]|nr:hypothetical protein [Allobaculum sp.]
YVLRSSYEFDTDVIDMWYKSKVRTKTVRTSITTPFVASYSQGCFILGVISNSEYGIGSTTYYAMEPAQFRNFNKFMMENVDWLDIDFSLITEITESLFKTLFNPYQYVVSCQWIPIPRTAISTTAVASIPYGWWNIPAGAYRINEVSWNGNMTVKIPKHPQESRGNYMNFQPYTRHVLHFPPFGDIPVDPMMYYNGNMANFSITMDLITGEGYLYSVSSGTLDGSSDPIIYQSINAQLGVPVSFTQMGINVAKTAQEYLSGGFGAIGSILSGNIGGGISSIVNTSIGSAINMWKPETHVIGMNGNFSKYVDINSLPALESSFVYNVDEDNSHNGRPLCKVRTLGAIPGFILCEGASISTGGTYEENESIRNYLNGGFYYE